MKSPKSSFIFIETIFAVVLLSFVIGSFYHLTYDKELTSSIHSISKQLLSNSSSSHSTQKSVTLSFKDENNHEHVVSLKQKSYHDTNIYLEYYE